MAPTLCSGTVISHSFLSVELLELRQVVGDLEPGCLGADEDVRAGPNGGSVDERAQRDVNVGAVPHHGEEEGATRRAARVVRGFLAEDEAPIRAVRDLELLPLDAGEWLECRAGRGAAARAVTVRRVKEFVRYPIANRATPTLPGKLAVARCCCRSRARAGPYLLVAL